MPTQCLITFENNLEKVFYGGQLLNGHVELSLTNSKTVRGIFVEVSGIAYCRWTEGTGDSKKTYTGNETYLNERTYLIGGRNDEIEVQPGSYNYNFECHLPLDLPTSLEAEIGHIRYMAKLVLDRPMWPDQEYEALFTVIKPLNLNLDPSLRLPSVQEKYKTFYPCYIFCCCPSKPMHLRAQVPVRGYTPGQTINIQIEADNKSEEEAELSVQLMKQITYHIYANSSRQRIETIMICEKGQVGIIRINSSKIYHTLLLIPPIPPTDTETSNICKVRYILRVLGSVSGCHNDAIVDMPIMIGSYPIIDQQKMNGFPLITGVTPIVQQPAIGFNPLSTGEIPQPSDALLPEQGLSQQYLPTAPQLTNPALPSVASNPSAPYPESDPPTYEQAVMDNKADGKTYRPSYPVYRRATSYSSNS